MTAAPASVPGGGRGLRHGVFVAPFDDLADPHVVVDLARLAEARGWDGFFVWDHVMRPEVRPVADPWVVLAAVAANTSRMRLGPMVTPLPRRRPQKVAREALTLDRLSRGRLVLGLGLGVDSGRELSAFGEQTDDRRRGDMLDEGLGLLVDLMSGHEVDHHSEHYTADRVRFEPVSDQPGGIPIWLAARTAARRPLRRAAGRDGLFVIEQDPETISDMVGFIETQRGGLEGFDVATVARPGCDPVDFAAAGVTWWMSGEGEGVPAGDAFDVVGGGPPR